MVEDLLWFKSTLPYESVELLDPLVWSCNAGFAGVLWSVEPFGAEKVGVVCIEGVKSGTAAESGVSVRGVVIGGVVVACGRGVSLINKVSGRKGGGAVLGPPPIDIILDSPYGIINGG